MAPTAECWRHLLITFEKLATAYRPWMVQRPTPAEAEAAYVVNIKNSTCHRDYAIVLRQIL
jgi:hypothetical protein